MWIKYIKEEYPMRYKSLVRFRELVDFISEQEEKIQQIEERQKEIYRESSSRKRSIKNEERHREYQIWHVEAQEELDELKQEKEKIVADRDVEIPEMNENTAVEK